jgi:hypothetical protein
MRARSLVQRLHEPLGEHRAGRLLVDRDVLARRADQRPPARDLAGVELLERPVVVAVVGDRPSVVALLGRAEVDGAGPLEQPDAELPLELAERRKRLDRERHVDRAAAVGLPIHPRGRVRRAVRVGVRVLIDGEHPVPASRQVVRGGRPPRPQADDDDLVMRH